MKITAPFLIALCSILFVACANETDNNREGSPTGIICGRIGYPTDFEIPKIKVCCRNANSNKVYSIVTNTDDTTYCITGLPEGIYYVYAFTTESVVTNANGQKEKGIGGYTYAVPCGLSVSCKNHYLIPVKVTSNAKIKHVDVSDWFEAIVPIQ